MMSDWTLFSNHGHVLVCLARDSEARLRDVASDVGITERAVQKIVHELQQAGFVSIRKHGRCNRYEINTRA
jgi:predicted transcriptional regulator